MPRVTDSAGSGENAPLHGVEALHEAVELRRGPEVLQGKQQVREADGVKELAKVLLDIDAILIQGGEDLEKGIFAVPRPLQRP